MSIELLPFQTKAADQIVSRYSDLMADERRPAVNRYWFVPFYQALSALTGGGKTPILADSVAQIRALQSIEPIVLWISKGRAVVDQTFANFQPGGKYKQFVEQFVVEYLSEVRPELLQDATSPVLCLATAGTFNRAERTLRVHTERQDRAGAPLWTLLRERTADGHRRPLILVYDEGHNLSDQQTELLLELEPDAILVASATMKTPAALGRLIQRLRDHGWSDDQLITTVPSKEVVREQLVKQQIVLGGYATVMESVLDDMLQEFRSATQKAEDLDLDFRPKAIYVCQTNVSQDDGSRDLPSKPFRERKAPPILIWRYLVEKKGVSPDDIAVYCDLRFDRRAHPPPDEFILFSGGEEDFASFSAGQFKHVIFNLGLQEGWDDPACAFAYIDKSMGAPLQIEQIIGRVLRQPGARHYTDASLNTAHFYIRIDDRQAFPQILDTVRKRVTADIPQIQISSFTDSRGRKRTRVEPKQFTTIAELHIDATEALDPLAEELAVMGDFRQASVNTRGPGELLRAVQAIGDHSTPAIAVSTTAHSNRVMARWLMRRTILGLYPEVVKTIDWSDDRFDAAIEMRSPAAAALRQTAERMVDIYLRECELRFEPDNLREIGAVVVDPAKAISFKNAVHAKYSDLNPFERLFAEALDDTPDILWVRNPPIGGYSMPLLQKGSNRRFFPDFLAWKGKHIFAIDPKADHLIGTEAGRKLLDVRDDRGVRRLIVRLISRGRWSDPQHRLSSKGLTVWSLGSGNSIRARHVDSPAEAIKLAFKA